MPSQSEARAILADPARAMIYSDLTRALLWMVALGRPPVVFVRGGRV